MILWDRYLSLHHNVNLSVFLHNKNNSISNSNNYLNLKWPIQYSVTLQILADLKLNKWFIVKKQNNASLKNVIKYHIIIL